MPGNKAALKAPRPPEECLLPSAAACKAQTELCTTATHQLLAARTEAEATSNQEVSTSLQQPAA